MFHRSKDILNQPEWSNVRALYKSNGFTDEELEKPIIAVVNSFNTICPGHYNLNNLTQYVREGIRAAGGTPVEFGTIAACDGMAMGHKGMRHILPTRELIANDIEMMIEAHRLDGMVLLGSCDKIVPGMLMAAARLDIPAVFVNGGPTLPGRMKENNPYGGEHIDHSIIQQSLGSLNTDTMSWDQYMWLEDNACPTIGSCAMLGTANTMCCLAEAMGMSLPGSAVIPAVYSHRMAIAFQSGKAVMKLVHKGITARQIITRQALTNAIKVNSAIGGSTNAVLHTLAIAYEGEIDLSLEDFGNISREVPHLSPMIPGGPYALLDFYEAGGIPAIMKELETVLDLDTITVTGKTLEENIKNARVLNKDVIKDLSNPVTTNSGIAILKGNLAPEGAVTKPSAIPKDALTFTGPAVVFESEKDALEEIATNKVQAGNVIVIRNEGPKGGPGMPEMYKAMKMLVGMNLGSRVCVITDGRFSGSNNGCFVGHICPEAAVGGPIAYVKNGDIISVDVEGGSIQVLSEDFEDRLKEKVQLPKNKAQGYLHVYANIVTSASRGAVIPTREEA
ncbi:dihydroxy-acid dehydratase [Clostridium formicaceticum]|uniref:Dihydroxy-acid dehydratase n=1 Tax=Clostridium formicaceticum TaxID=1497 RepID=A0AAC9RM42_9CLOT|nr:dihydroxy-acid dehydratase [Clostridium formicaceticum]AOY75282.1 dihydroxy-acid dehydratase [Clostridium formicaceticum]ARE89721.1 Dihydroxy-acid dehydratase [Clostridium formicaceticum]